MTDRLFRRIVVPVASVEDAETTCEQVRRVLRDGGGKVLTVHVVEKAGGAPDKASVEQREEWAREMFDVVEDELSAERVAVETDILYGTDVAEAILDAADEFDATAVVFTPRGGSRWLKLFTGDTATDLMESADRPVVVLPDAEDGGGVSGAEDGIDLSGAEGGTDLSDTEDGIDFSDAEDGTDRADSG